MERKYLCLAHMSGNEQKYIQEAFDTNWVVPLGPNVNAFEEELVRFCKSKPNNINFSNEVYPRSIQAHNDNPDELWNDGYKELENKEVVALCSGTSAIHLALINLGVKAGDEVICQSFTFCASSHPVMYLGASPVFVDSEVDTWNMSPELLERAIKDRIEKTGKKPKAIIVVYLYGMPAKIKEIIEIAERYGIPVVEDAAEGLGSRYNKQVVGTFGDYGIMSFNGNKMITTSGGGAIVCPNKEAKERIMFFATQAREAFPYYQHEEIGYNYRLSNICAGIGRGQMTVLDEHIAHHKHLANLYKEGFKDVKGITFHNNPNEEYDSNFWLNTITLDKELKVIGQENAYNEAIAGAVGGAAGVVHSTGKAHTNCEPNTNVEAMRMALDKLGIEHDFVETLGTTRINMKLTTDTETEINGQSSAVNAENITEFFAKLDVLTTEDVVFLSGNVISGMELEDFKKIAEKVADKGATLVVDSNKDLVLDTLQYKPFVVKPNEFELGEMFGITLNGLEEILVYTRKLQERGAQNVLVSRGAKGAILLTENDEVLEVNVAEGKIVSTVAAGDSMLAMFVAKYNETKDYAEALKYASAAGGATSFSVGVGSKELIEELLPQIKVKKLK